MKLRITSWWWITYAAVLSSLALPYGASARELDAAVASGTAPSDAGTLGAKRMGKGVDAGVGADADAQAQALREKLNSLVPLPPTNGQALPDALGENPVSASPEEQLRLLKEAAATLSSCERGLWEALPVRPWEVDSAEDNTQHGSAEAYGTLIATLPNPFSTGSAALFELALEGVYAAIADGGYLLDRGWFWDPARTSVSAPEAEAAGEKSSEKESATEKAKSVAADKSKCSSLLPGVVLFRAKQSAESESDAGTPVQDEASRTESESDASAPGQDKPSWLVLFLVGESSVWGLERKAMLRALEASRPSNGSLRIVGPYYSGSAQSMKDILDSKDGRAARERHSARPQLASGTLTVGDQQKILARDYGAQFFVDTREKRRDLLFDFIEGEPEAEGGEPRMALLRESDAVAFGAPGTKAAGRQWLEIPLSNSVASWRKAYADVERKRAEREQRSSPPWLSSHLDHDPSGPDLFPTPSAAAVVAFDLKVAAIIETLRERGITNVGIHLHSVEDTIFVAKYLRRAMPEMRPLLFVNDRMLVHPEHGAELDGSLIASPYLDLGPNLRDDLLPPPTKGDPCSTAADAEQIRAANARLLSPFARDSAVGIYRATSWMMECDRGRREKIKKAAGLEPRRAVIRRGKVWELSGNGKMSEKRNAKIQPSTVLSRTDEMDEQEKRRSPTSLSSALIVWATLLWSIWSAYDVFARKEPPTCMAWRTARLAPAVGAVVLVVVVYFASSRSALIVAGAAAAAAFVYVCGTVAIFDGVGAEGPLGAYPPRGALIKRLICMTFLMEMPLAALALGLACFWDIDAVTRTRALAFTSGVSPLTPMLLTFANAHSFLHCSNGHGCIRVPARFIQTFMVWLSALGFPVICLWHCFGADSGMSHGLTLEDGVLSYALVLVLLVSYAFMIQSLVTLFRSGSYVFNKLQNSLDTADFEHLPEAVAPFGRTVADILASNRPPGLSTFQSSHVMKRDEVQRYRSEKAAGKLEALVAQLRWPMINAVVSATFGLFVVNEYPFHPGRVLTSFAATLLMVAIGSCGWIYVRLERNPVLRLLSGKEKSWLGLPELLRFSAWAIIPVLIALNSYFPSVSYTIREWLSWRLELGTLP